MSPMWDNEPERAAGICVACGRHTDDGIAIAASGQQPGRSLAPSELVDHGWHAFILHTADYAQFCERIVGRFVHHVPTDEDETLPGGPQATRERTLAAIAAAGYAVDAELWGASADCSQCHSGCHDSPKSG
ncbi:glycine-rich domain-containing protein [Streptomyces chiangmaiensis]|uniref:Uncharacterized protein n=1 Tax=Streptomyces chiangmaiensis TaxID=766497 RepID=A0ABU7FU95_9ACTN|nr:hypothetical protein [Streptomyces chiangmaiensis]MED7827672.1 hypothetical protein [Streptomyces chiangmaiensis]